MSSFLACCKFDYRGSRQIDAPARSPCQDAVAGSTILQIALDEGCRRSDPVLAETNEIDILEKLTAQFIARRYVWSAA